TLWDNVVHVSSKVLRRVISDVEVVIGYVCGGDDGGAVFDDEEVTMTMDQTLIKMKAKKSRLLDEQMAKRLHNEKVEQAAAREKQEQDDFKRAQELQQQYDQKQENIDWHIVVEQVQEKHLDNIGKYQSLKRKPIFVAQARKNMIVYLKNMAGVQTFLKSDRDEEPVKKRGAKETLLQESFKKLRAEVEASGSHFTHDTPTDDPKEMSKEDVKNMLQFVLVAELKRLTKEKFSTTMPTEDKEKALLIELKRLYEPNAAERSCDEDIHGCQQAKEQKEFGYILQMIKKLELKKLDDLLAGVDVVQRLYENALRDYCCWLKY
nr:hypothetical protein [Tanacetum cinerariifolium]